MKPIELEIELFCRGMRIDGSVGGDGRPIGRPSLASDSRRRPRQNSSISSSTGFNTRSVNGGGAAGYVSAVTRRCASLYGVREAGKRC